jgi:hypothetical protein
MRAMSTAHFCSNCGTQATEGQRFCSNCGAALDAAAAQVPAPPPTAAAAPTATPAGASMIANLPWPAWVGIAALGIVAIGTGLSWIGFLDTTFSAFDIPFARLVSDTATGGVPLGAVLLTFAGIAMLVALFLPEPRPISLALLLAGSASALFIGWYIVRVISEDTGDAGSLLQYGVWIAGIGAIAAIVTGAMLVNPPRRV